MISPNFIKFYKENDLNKIMCWECPAIISENYCFVLKKKINDSLLFPLSLEKFMKKHKLCQPFDWHLAVLKYI